MNVDNMMIYVYIIYDHFPWISRLFSHDVLLFLLGFSCCNIPTLQLKYSVSMAIAGSHRGTAPYKVIFWWCILIFAYALLHNLSQILDMVGTSQSGIQQNVFFSWLKYHLSIAPKIIGLPVIIVLSPIRTGDLYRFVPICAVLVHNYTYYSNPPTK